MRPSGVTLRAPAKVNLFLRVGGRRPDGFHEIETLFQAVELFDRVEVTPGGDEVRLEVEGAELGPPEENLAFRAAQAVRRAVNGAPGVHLRLVKRIPAGAGLGGGSSDAAAVLRAVNALCPRPLGRETLAGLGAALGSDVPFFLGPTPLAVGWGRGERLHWLPPLPPAPIVLVLPPVHVSTPEAYRALGRNPSEPRGGSEGTPPPIAGPRSWSSVAETAHNDFEPVVAGRHPEVNRSLAALRASGARPALLSGSGGACFGLFPDAAAARSAAQALSHDLGWPAVATRTSGDMPELEPGGRGGG